MKGKFRLGLITVVTYGLGNLLGSLFAGAVLDYFTTEAGSNRTAVFLVPCVLTILCAFPPPDLESFVPAVARGEWNPKRA